MRPPRRQGAGADEPVHPDARVRAARRGRPRRADDPRRPDRRALRDAPHERRRRAGPRVPHRGADAGGLLPRAARNRGADRPRARVRAVRGPHLVRDVDARPRRGRAVRRGRAREVPGQAPRVQLLAVLQLEEAPGRQDDRGLPARARRPGLPFPVRDPRRLPRCLRVDVRPRARLRRGGHERLRPAPGAGVLARGVRVHGDPPPARGGRRATSTPCSRRSPAGRARRSRSRARPRKSSSSPSARSCVGASAGAGHPAMRPPASPSSRRTRPES